jgi:acyl carrier protein
MSVLEAVQQELARAKAKATGPEMRLREDAGLSSLALIQVLTRLCQRLEVDIYSLSDRDFAGMATVGDLAGLMQSRLPASAGEG